MLRSHSFTVQKALSLLLESVVTVCSHLLAKTLLVSESSFVLLLFISRLDILVGPSTERHLKAFQLALKKISK